MSRITSLVDTTKHDFSQLARLRDDRKADRYRETLLRGLDLSESVQMVTEVEGDTGIELQRVDTSWDAIEIQSSENSLIVLRDGQIHPATDKHLSGKYINQPIKSALQRRLWERKKMENDLYVNNVNNNDRANLIRMLSADKTSIFYRFDEERGVSTVKMDYSYIEIELDVYFSTVYATFRIDGTLMGVDNHAGRGIVVDGDIMQIIDNSMLRLACRQSNKISDLLS